MSKCIRNRVAIKCFKSGLCDSRPERQIITDYDENEKPNDSTIDLVYYCFIVSLNQHWKSAQVCRLRRLLLPSDTTLKYN